MVRASAVAEKAGVTSVSIVASGFMRQGGAVAKALGVENLALAEYPGLPMIDSKEELRRKVEDVLVGNVVRGLTMPARDAVKPVEPGPKDTVFRGTLEEVQEFFYDNLWTDGLPIMPPTLDRVAEFLRFTGRSPDEVIGVLLPENREATVWNVAVNGVMAGCRPQYMPVLVAIVEAIAEPEFRIEDAGSTPGWEPLVIVNGPIVKELDFNYGSGAMRVGRQANTSIGRFLRLYMRNVPGLRIPPGATDKGTFAQSFNVVLAENEDAIAELGWQTFGVDRGFKAGENVVTVQSVISISPPAYTGGEKPIDHLATLAELIGHRSMAYKTGSAAHFGRFHPLFVLSPSVAGVLARGGWTKDDIRRYLYETVREPATILETIQRGLTSHRFCAAVEQGILSKDFCLSTDPNRLVPVFLRPDWIGVVVSGDPGRNQCKGYVQNHKQGVPVSKRVEPRSRGRLAGQCQASSR
ncbi:MAG: hypothetical protein HYX92_03145 [Chloroflexi bacterium]|nr:hypothetical protein [Chloroflexota bacterium]